MGAVTGLSMTTMSKARYIAAASGGAYTASAMRRHYRSASREMPFAEGSPELRRLRARSSFLFLDGRDGRFTVGRAIATVIFNALILYLVMFAVARPVGWAISYIHPELRAMSPMIDSIELDDLRANVAVDRESADVGADCGGDEAAPATYWTFEAKDPGTYSLAFRLAPNDSIDDDTEKPSFPLMHATKGLIRACGSRLEIVRQPTLRIAPPEPFTGKLKIAQQPTYKIAGQSDFPPTDASVRAEIKVDEKLEIEAKTDAVDRPNISIESWMWIVLGIAAVMMFIAYALPWTVWRGRPDATMRQGHWITFWTAATIVWGAVMVVVPWLAQELPRLFDDLPGLLAGAKAPATSDITVAITWVVTMLTSGGLAKIVISRLNKPAAKVKRASRFTLKLASYVLLTLSGLIVIVVTANQGAMNRPGGLGLGSGAEGWSGFFVTSDLGNWAAAVVVLWALQRWVATHVWSLHPLYRDRLAAAFIRTAADAKAAPKVRKQMRFADAGHVPDEWPELLVCCAANLNDLSGEIPAKRWADSFVFSATHVGGPTITYMPTATYEQRLSKRRKKDLSVESVVAVSGAAFSPAMGNQDFGPIGGLFAALNLRLGIWMPTPLSVRHTAVADGWDDNPGWSFLIRELFGRFSYRDGFVYTSDGGHWENLGLVELIRHGCNEIIVISAAGDSVDYFPTLGDAIALAREQTRVDIQIDPSALRPRRGEELPKNGRQQLREVDGSAKSQPMAADPYTVGWFTRPNGERGIVLFVEAALTKDTPWDVHAFGEGHAIFPDHPTTNQFYNHRTFEAYRVLGEYQARTAVASDKWQVAQAWRASTEPARDGPFRATPAPPAAPTKVEFTNPLIVHER